MKRPLVIIKLGGSVITDKSRGRSAFRKDIVSRLIREILYAKKKKDFDLILVHGAGAYPHFLTTKYKLKDGFKGKKSALGFALVKKELFRLNLFVWDLCLKSGLIVSTLQPGASIMTWGGKIRYFDTKILEKQLRMGLSPLLFGEDVVDAKSDMAVLSGDKTIAHLAKKLHASKVIFVSDVDGVFDKNPKVYKNVKLIREINHENFHSVVDSMESYNKNDASGEMKGKLEAIKNELEGIDVRIIGGFIDGNLETVLLGGIVGTRILF